MLAASFKLFSLLTLVASGSSLAAAMPAAAGAGPTSHIDIAARSPSPSFGKAGSKTCPAWAEGAGRPNFNGGAQPTQSEVFSNMTAALKFFDANDWILAACPSGFIKGVTGPNALQVPDGTPSALGELVISDGPFAVVGGGRYLNGAWPSLVKPADTPPLHFPPLPVGHHRDARTLDVRLPVRRSVLKTMRGRFDRFAVAMSRFHIPTLFKLRRMMHMLDSDLVRTVSPL
ncbi:hypothetical protein C8Q79DRAFT_928475 [Trametes meyenii]|nr:hypothetical protein C8Q79DRAFT_928475 [Trametes meyenii]